MPPPALKSLAKKASGKSVKDAERYYKDAKKQRMDKTGRGEDDLTDRDYEFIMGVVKKRLGLPTGEPGESKNEIAGAVAKGAAAAVGSALAKKAMGKKKKNESLAESMIDSQLASADDQQVRVFRDMEGELSFATMDDVHIEPSSDVRVMLLHKLANEYDWPHNHPFPESIEGYEGSLKSLAQSVLGMLSGNQS